MAIASSAPIVRAPHEPPRKTVIVHLSDFHLLSRKPDFNAWFGSLGRRMDCELRLSKARRALDRAKAIDADHLVITGDLTETGRIEEFEVLAEALLSSGLPPHRFTLLPGNHDVYASADSWSRALAGPLAPFAENSAKRPGDVVESQALIIVPIDTTMHQTVLRSAGALHPDAVEAVAKTLRDPKWNDCARLLAMHHPPYALSSRLWHWQDGLQGVEALSDVFADALPMTILHGHVHRARSSALGAHTVSSISATVDDEEDARIAVYSVTTEGGQAARLTRTA